MFVLSSEKKNLGRESAALIICAALSFSASGCVAMTDEASRIERVSGNNFIVDRTGHRWDITQAVSIGFKPERFQYGLGKDAFVPLDDASFVDGSAESRPDLRVIGISGNY